jgi:hypothetical protein
MMDSIYEMLCESKIMYGIQVWGLNKAWKELGKVHSGSCNKLMGVVKCAVSGFAKMEVGRQSTRGKGIEQIVEYLYQIMHSYIEDLAQPHNEWQMSDTSVKSWTMELKEQLFNIKLAFVWRKQQECNLRQIAESVKVRCNCNERQNILAEMSVTSSLTLYQDMNFISVKMPYEERSSRKES